MSASKLLLLSLCPCPKKQHDLFNPRLVVPLDFPTWVPSSSFATLQLRQQLVKHLGKDSAASLGWALFHKPLNNLAWDSLVGLPHVHHPQHVKLSLSLSLSPSLYLMCWLFSRFPAAECSSLSFSSKYSIAQWQCHLQVRPFATTSLHKQSADGLQKLPSRKNRSSAFMETLENQNQCTLNKMSTLNPLSTFRKNIANPLEFIFAILESLWPANLLNCNGAVMLDLPICTYQLSGYGIGHHGPRVFLPETVPSMRKKRGHFGLGGFVTGPQ